MKNRVYLFVILLFFGIFSGSLFAEASSVSRAGRILTAENTKQAGIFFEKVIAKDLAGSNSAFKCGNFLKRLMDAAEEGGISEQAVKDTLYSLANAAERLAAKGEPIGYVGKFISDNDADAVFGFVALFAKNRSHLKPDEVARFVYAVGKNYPQKDLTTLMKKMGDFHRRGIPGVSYTHATEYSVDGVTAAHQLKETRHYAGLLSYLKADNENALKGFINEIEAADALLEFGYDVVQMGRRFSLNGKSYFSDIDIICRSGDRTFLVQCKVSGDTLASDIKGFSANLHAQLRSVRADFGILEKSGTVADAVIDQIRFLVPEGTMPGPSQLEKIGEEILASLTKEADPEELVEIVNKFRTASGQIKITDPLQATLNQRDVLHLFIRDAPYPLGL